mgnify:CR=1 FL=1
MMVALTLSIKPFSSRFFFDFPLCEIKKEAIFEVNLSSKR